MLDHHVVLLLQVDPLDQGLYLVGQPLSDSPVGRDLGGVVPEDSLHQDTARARTVTCRMTGRLVPDDTLTVERETFRVVIDGVVSNYWNSIIQTLRFLKSS